MTFARAVRSAGSGFNPYSHAGSDVVQHAGDDLIPVSIHTPTRGVTERLVKTEVLSFVSIHTPTQGVTNIKTCPIGIERFQSTLQRRERRNDVRASIDAEDVSIHTPT